ncbi:hypothetical protein HYH02_001732 [Chlamydomonas schloesseri]|uniref:RecF/RecN/SMC N-terminal domain-containing protein n=1 Tax=Chlamydomonas schloesseri TaxID=2026947 RepID=A0A835WU63_9CHLO|nr:hypothetical protein HYH02_001732 [Chlamydomonas schloesseri]|eukprot:KAG2453512.1 hypothetical protein HYH02_001732 [Chlamydomonas schloesseri]
MEPEPKTLREAKAYIGRSVFKRFKVDERGGGRASYQFFHGTCTKVEVFDGICYRIQYEDGDGEHLAWKEFHAVLQPLPEDQHRAPPSSGPSRRAGLSDATNRLAMPPSDSNGAMFADKPTGTKRQRTIKTEPAASLQPSDSGTALTEEPPLRTAQAARSSKRKSAGGAAIAAAKQEMEAQQKQDEELRGGNATAAGTERPVKRRATAEEPAGAGGPTEGVSMAPANAGPRNQGFVVRERGLAGHVQRIHVQNFMCHSNFEIEIGPHVTLVSGQNGSGKSAVIQALQVCLGASARETSRARSLTAFVKEGCSEARVRVTLWNVGEDAYLPHIFGERITVERVIKVAGGNDTTLLDARGKKAAVERHRDTLSAMLEHFCLDATNPLTIITQDKARQFLSGEKDSSRDKYDVFMEGTLLQRQLDENNLAGVKLEQSSHRLAESAAHLKTLETAQACLQAKLQRLMDADKMLEQRDYLEKAIAWAHVRELEAAAARGAASAEQHGPALVELYEKALLQLGASRAELQQRLKEHEEVVARNQEVLDNHKANAAKLIKDVRKAAEDQQRETRNRTSAKTNLQALQRNQQEMNAKLAEASTGNEKVAEAQRLLEEHQQKITAKKYEEERAKTAADEALKQLEELQAHAQAMVNDEMRGRDRIQQSQQALRDSQDQLRALVASNGNRLGAFQAVRLCELISANMRRFQRPPIGPLGAYLSVTEGRWAVAAQSITNLCLRDFIVSCGADALLLNQLMATAGYARCSTITVNYDDPPHRIPPTVHPGGGYPALLDVLVVKDDEARVPLLNYLVDRFHVERVALAENEPSGRKVVYENAAGNHVTLAVDQNGSTFHRNKGLKWVKHERSITARNCLLKADVSEMEASLRAELEAEEAQLGALQQDLAQLVAQRQAKEAEVKAAQQRLQQAQRLKARLMTECRRLEQSMPMVPEAEDEEQQVVMTQLQSIHLEIVDSQRVLLLAQDALDIAEKDWNAAKERAAEAERIFQEVLKEGGAKRDAKAEVECRLKELEAMRTAYKAERAIAVSRLAALKTHLDKARERVQATVAAAETVCSREEGEEALAKAREVMEEHMRALMARKKERQQQPDLAEDVLQREIDNRMNPRDLPGLLARVNKAIEKVQEEAGADKEQLRIKLADLSRQLSLKRVLHARVSKTTSMLAASMDRRRQLYTRVLGGVEKLVNAKFGSYLRRRDHLGEVKWDHERRQLKLRVKVNGKNNPNAPFVDDLKQMSGGERSYITVAFLLAVGANTESPFRVMDEYDVFMDAENRRIATQTLLEFARDQAAFQFIFLTPQDLATVEAARQTLVSKSKVDMPPGFLKTVHIRPPRG